MAFHSLTRSCQFYPFLKFDHDTLSQELIHIYTVLKLTIGSVADLTNSHGITTLEHLLLKQELINSMSFTGVPPLEQERLNGFWYWLHYWRHSRGTRPNISTDLTSLNFENFMEFTFDAVQGFMERTGANGLDIMYELMDKGYTG